MIEEYDCVAFPPCVTGDLHKWNSQHNMSHQKGHLLVSYFISYIEKRLLSLGHEDAVSFFPSFFINLLLQPVEATSTWYGCCSAEAGGQSCRGDATVNGTSWWWCEWTRNVPPLGHPTRQHPCLSTSPGTAAGQREGNVSHPEVT